MPRIAFKWSNATLDTLAEAAFEGFSVGTAPPTLTAELRACIAERTVLALKDAN